MSITSVHVRWLIQRSFVSRNASYHFNKAGPGCTLPLLLGGEQEADSEQQMSRLQPDCSSCKYNMLAT